jgi:di/tricarboxylate transporter
MGWDAWTTIGLTVLGLVAMARNLAAPDTVMIGQMVVLMALGILTPQQAVAGFSNEGMLSVAVLFVVAAAVQETGALDVLARRVLGRPRSMAGALLRMIFPVASASAFLNNTPIVAMLLPVVVDWARRMRMAPSKLLIPLSFATILGGTCSLIGTSTNLVVLGFAQGLAQPLKIGMFELAWVGLPVAFAGVLYMIVAQRWLLPDRGTTGTQVENPREYMVAMRVEPDSPVVGQSIERAGLRHLPGLYLVQLERDGEVLPAVGPDVRLHAGDELLFTGVVDSVADLRRIRGLTPANGIGDRLNVKRPDRILVEAVVGPVSPLVGQSVRASRFRTQHNAAIIAVRRDGARVPAKVGDIVLEAGDTLLLDTHPSFIERYRNDRAFALVSGVDNSAPPRHEKAGLAAVIVLAMVIVNAAELLPLLSSVLLAAVALVGTRCIKASDARRSIEMGTLLAIVGSLAVGKALEATGAAEQLGAVLVALGAPFGAMGTITAVYVATTLLTNFVSNNAAVALMFPIAIAAAAEAALPLKSMAFILMLAGSAAFSTPIGYQTNLMVYGPGRYRFADFLLFGLPMQVVVGVVTLAVAWAVWF